MTLESKAIKMALPIVLLLTLLSLITQRIVFTWSKGGEERTTVANPAPTPASKGMVASANRLATLVGVDVLKMGGNAVDAAVATAFALGVVEPFASGIGGGGFMLIYRAKTGEIVTIDYRECAPLKPIPAGIRLDEGHAAVAVPGTVAGLAFALKRFGTIKMKAIVAPSIELAEKGFQVSPLLSNMMENNRAKLSRYPEAKKIFLKGGQAYRVGDRLYQRDLAGTMRLIAAQGPGAFYGGPVATALEKEMARSGRGVLSTKELSNYRPILRAPVQGSYRGYRIFSMGPPSSGGTHIIQILNILEGYDIRGLGQNTVHSIPVVVRAMGKAFADRERYMGDPDFVKVPLELLLSKDYAERLRREVSDGKIPGKEPAPPEESVQTTHVSVVDGEGNMVALTQTINSFFGSGVVVPGTGILLNNEMKDFSGIPGSPNGVKPGKRPLSSMSPTLVLKGGKPWLTIGMPGAVRIISVQPQILMNMIDHGMGIGEAVDAPRLHSVDGRRIYLESRIPRKVRETLAGKGYEVTVKKKFDLYFGGAQGVAVDPVPGELHGAADPRREGYVAGY